MAEEKTDTEKDNYERLLFAIAILYAINLGIDVEKVDEYSKLSEAQKTFAIKIYKKHPEFDKQIKRTEDRLSELQIMSNIAKILQNDRRNTVNGSRFAKWISVGDEKVCGMCSKWQNHIVCVSGNPYGYPTIDDVIKSGALHYGCRCALIDISTDEIKLSDVNPRTEQRKKSRPDIYNSTPTEFLVFN